MFWEDGFTGDGEKIKLGGWMCCPSGTRGFVMTPMDVSFGAAVRTLSLGVTLADVTAATGVWAFSSTGAATGAPFVGVG